MSFRDTAKSDDNNSDTLLGCNVEKQENLTNPQQHGIVLGGPFSVTSWIPSAFKPHSRQLSSAQLFNYLLLANFFQYLEAGAVPALLLSLSQSFEMSSGQQGLLGGVVYLSLGMGGPFAAYLLKKFEHKTVVVCAVLANMLCTFLWAMTPVGYTYSTLMFIVMRFMMGLCQCIVCVFLPLWTNENAPRESRTTWMSYLQASVPFGVMMGYIVASICLSLAQESNECYHLLCWRWPFLIEIFLLSPVCFCLYLVPKRLMSIMVGKPTAKRSGSESAQNKANLYRPVDSTPYPVIENEAGSNKLNGLLVSEGSSFRKGIHSGHPGGSESHSHKCERETAQHKDVESGGSMNWRENGNVHRPPHRNSRQGDYRDGPTGQWMTSLSKEALEEKKRRMSWRRNSMNASLFDPLSTRDMIKRSHDNIALLDPNDDMFAIIGGFRWTEMGTPDPESADETVEETKQERTNSRENEALANSANSLFTRKSLPLSSYGSFDAHYSMSGSNMLVNPEAHPSSKHDSLSRVSSDSSSARFNRMTKSLSVPRKLPNRRLLEDEPPWKYESLKEARRKSLAQEWNSFTPILGRKRASSTSGINGFVGNSRGGCQLPLGIASVSDRSVTIQNSRSRLSPAIEHPLKTSRRYSRPDLGISGEASLAAQQQLQQQQTLEPMVGATDPGDLLLLSGNAIDLSRSHSSDSIGEGAGQHGNRSREMILTANEDSFIEEEEGEEVPTQRPIAYRNLVTSPASDDYPSPSGSDSGDDWADLSPVRTFSHSRDTEYHRLSGRGRPSSAAHPKRISWLRSIARLLQISVYRNLLGAMTALYFTVTGVQYWGTKYLTISLNASLPLVHSLFVLCAATGPTFGVFFGGWVIDFFGGYKGCRQRVMALEICTVMGALACIFSFPITFLSEIFEVVIFLWLLLFFGASILPACSGILVTIVPRYHRPTSSSLSLVIFNMLGYFLSLVLSGGLMELLEGKYFAYNEVQAMTWGFRLILCGSCFGAFFLINALYASHRTKKEREKRRSLFVDMAVSSDYR